MLNSNNKIINTLVTNYINQLKKDNEDDITFNEANTSVLIIAEIYEMLSDTNEIDEILLKNMRVIRRCIIENKLYGNSAIFDGLSESALSLHAIYKNTGKFEKFYRKVNMLLIEWTEEFLKYIDKENDLQIRFYDTILGISGICNYLLLANTNNKYDSTIKKILNKLIYISGKRKINENYIPNWYIKNENLMTDKDKECFKDGYLNFGLSHGIAGPLVVLSKAYKKGIRVNGQIEAIRNIIFEYKRLHYIIDGSTYWTGLLDPKYYLENEAINNKVASRESWCYGAIGIAKAILLSATYIDDNESSEWAYEIIKEKARLNIDKYMLLSDTLCHGFSGVLSILVDTNKIYNNKDIENGIIKLEKHLLNNYNSNLKYGFYDTEIKVEGNNILKIQHDRNTVIDGAGGILLTLLSKYNYGNDYYMYKLLIK